MKDIDNINVSKELANDTIAKADRALRKKRVRIISGTSIAAVACACVVFAFSIGNTSPHVPDVVVDNNPQATSTLTSEEEKALNYARTRHISVYPLMNIENTDRIYIDFDETPTYVEKLEGNSTAYELAKYGYATIDPVGEKNIDNYTSYLVAFNTPSTNLRYVISDIQFGENQILFEYTCLDLGPFTAENYGPMRPTLPAESTAGFLIKIPSTSDDMAVKAEYIKWSDLSDEKKVSNVFDTIIKHDDLKNIVDEGAEKSLAFELAVLRDYSNLAIDYIKEYLQGRIFSGFRSDFDIVSSKMLYNLLNYYQLDNYDMSDPIQTIKKELLTQALASEDKTPDILIIPEVHIFEQILSEENPYALVYTSVFSFDSSYELSEKQQAINVQLTKKNDGTWEIKKLIKYTNTEEDLYKFMREYTERISDFDIDAINEELKRLAQDQFDSLASYTYEPPIDIYSNLTDTIRDFTSVPIVINDTSSLGFTLDAPITIKVEDYKGMFEKYDILPDDFCHSDASSNLNNFAYDLENNDIYIILFPANQLTRYDEINLSIKDNSATFYYSAFKIALEASINASTKGFLIAIPKDLEVDVLYESQEDWRSVDFQYQIEILLDNILTDPIRSFTTDDSYNLRADATQEITAIINMQENAISFLRDMRYQMDSSSSNINENEKTLVDGLLNVLVQNKLEKSLDYSTPHNAISLYLYDMQKQYAEPSPNQCILFSYLEAGNDFSQYNNGYATYYMMVHTTWINSIHVHGYSSYPAKIKLKLDDTDQWRVISFEEAYTVDDVNSLFGDFTSEYNEFFDIGIREDMANSSKENFIQLLGEYASDNTNSNEIDFTWIKQNQISDYRDIYSTYAAIARDLITHILDKNYNDDDLQVTSLYPLFEDFDNPITVAVLATTYDGKTTESQYAKLYVVEAEYDKDTWELINISVEEKEKLSMYEYPKLQHRGFDATYNTLYEMLITNVKDINQAFNISIPKPLLKTTPLSGVYTNLGMASGVARFVNVQRYIRIEEDSGCQILPWYAADNPTRISNETFTQSILEADWVEVAEGEEGLPYSSTELGLVGFGVDLYLENENGLHEFHYTFDTVKETAILKLNLDGERAKYYTTADPKIVDAMLEVFSIETDVSAYILSDEKGPTLPDYREELRFLTPIVGDMPGGIFSIETSVSSEIEAKGYSGSTIDDEEELINWAQEVGDILDSYSVSDINSIPTLENASIVWSITPAAQEGIGKIQILGYADSDVLYIRKTYRLYGSPEAHEQYYMIESSALFDKLCELSFGEILSN